MQHHRLIIATGALLSSCALHAAGFGYGFQADTMDIAGGAPVGEVRLGNSFEDMVSGAKASPALPTPVTPPKLPRVSATGPATIQTPVITSLSIPMASPPPDIVAPVVAGPTTMPPAEDTPSSNQPTLDHAVASPTTEPAVAQKPIEVRTRDENTLRPQARPKRSEHQTPPREPQTVPPSRQGGRQDSRRGQNNGQQEAVAQQASQQHQVAAAQVAGNAAASNYDGIIMRHISRTRRRRAPARGEAAVAFHIGANGAVSRLRVVRSSGNPEVDAAAVAHIQRASPFPPPPTGARRDFGYIYEGRR